MLDKLKEILKNVEPGEGVEVKSNKVKEDTMQIGFSMANPIVDELKKLDPTILTPIEAMNTLYNLCQKAKES